MVLKYILIYVVTVNFENIYSDFKRPVKALFYVKVITIFISSEIAHNKIQWPLEEKRH